MVEMNPLKTCPKALLQKLLLTALVGIACFLVGAAYYLFSNDGITFALSGLVLIFSLVRNIGLYRTIAKQKYEVIEGTCVRVITKPLRKHFVIKILDDAGLESTIRLGKHAKVKIGFRYRFYFSQSEDGYVLSGNEYFDTALSSSHFLGFEELGEFVEK